VESKQIDISKKEVNNVVKLPNKIKATCIENIFDPYNSQKILEFDNGTSIGEIVSKFNPVICSDLEIVVSIDGIALEETEQEKIRGIVPKSGSCVVFSVVPKGGGGGGKNPLAMVAMLAVVVVANMTGQYWANAFIDSMYGTTVMTAGQMAFSSALTTGLQLGLTAIGGVLVNSVFGGPSLPDIGGVGSEDISSSPTYGWDTGVNPTEQGVAVPVLYGKFRVVPPVINQFITTEDDNQTFNALYCVADHAVDTMGNVYINDNPSYNYDEIFLEYRYGELDQGVIPAFADTYSDKAVGFKLSTDWSQTETSGNAVEGFGVGITIPGLFYGNDVGGLDKQTVTINIQYREKGTETWNDVYSEDAVYEEHTLSEERWSAGYVLSDGRWYEIEAGTTNESDHIEGDRYTSDSGKAYWKFQRITYRTQTLPGGSLINPNVVTTPVYPIVYTNTRLTDISISDATQEEVRRNYYVYNITPSQYEIRVRLKEAPKTGPRYKNDAYFSYIQEIIFDDFTYPNTSLMGMQALATDQLSGSAPVVSLEAERLYVDVWTGTEYEKKPANNPAWACYDMLHNSVYGGGQPVDRFIYEDFEEWAEYCELKNYTCNIYVDAATSNSSIVNTISQLGRGAIIYKGSQYGVVIDKVEPMSVQHFMFTKGNMIEDSYSNSFLDLTDRANAVEVTYFDANLDYSRQPIEIYQSGFDEVETSINKNSITLFGCTDRDMAIAHGRSILLRNRYLTQTISFEAGVDSIACLPGQVIDVSHDVPQWGISSGRIVSATTTSVTLPEEVDLVAGVSYSIKVKKSIDDSVETKNIIPVSVDTTTNTLNLVSAWASIPEKNDIYAFGRVDNVTKQFRVIAITRASDTQHRRITTIEYIPEVYADSGEVIDDIVIGDSRFVTDLTAREVWIFANDGTGKSVIDLTWGGNALSWNVFVKPEGGIWEKAGQSNVKKYRLDRSFSVGKNYHVSVTPYDTPDTSNTKTIYILGKEAPPSDVTGFTAAISGRNINLTWNHIPDIDFLQYNIVQGVDYERGIVIAEGVTENSFAWQPSISGTYNFWIKAVDRTFNESINAATASISIDISGLINVVIDREEIPDNVGTGTLEYLYYISTDEVLSWLPGLNDTQVGSDTDTDEPLASYDGTSNNGVYISDVIDLGVVTEFTLRQNAEKDAVLVNPTDQSFIYGRTDLTFPRDTDTSITSLAKYKLYYRYSDDNITYSSWIQYSGIVTLNTRYVQVKAETDITVTSTSYDFTSIKTVLDVDEKIKKLYNQTIASTGTEFLLSSIPITIFNSYNVGVTVLGSGFASYTVDIQSDRFTVYIYDATGTGIERDVNLEVVGF
jgi:predicted phage tail protein